MKRDSVSMMAAFGAGMAAAAVLAAMVRRSRARRSREPAVVADPRAADAGRWLVVTVNCSPERLRDLPAPLARLGTSIETRITPAPGGRGTELAARPLGPDRSGLLARLSGRDPRQAVRAALRDAKSLVETGEVLVPDFPTTTRTTVKGKVVELAVRRAGGEGRL